MEPTQDHKEHINFIKESIPSWKPLSDPDISFESQSGISNNVFKVTAKGDVSPKAVIFREFGDTSAVIDKDKESHIFELLSESGIGPHLYGKNEAFRIEECFDGEPIKREQINEPFWRRKLAFALAKYHSLNAPDLKKNNAILERLKDSEFWKNFEEKCSNSEWTEPDQIKKLDEIKKLACAEEKEFVKSIIPKRNLVFSHNDPLNGNILVATDTKVVFIDYEYSGYNNRGFDIAGLFTEMTISYDEPSSPYFKTETKLFPTEEDVKDFLRYYLYASKYYDGLFEELEEDVMKVEDDKWLFKKISDEIGQEEFDKEMGVLLDEFEKCCLLTHYYWAPWAVIMSQPKSEPGNFDYLTFAYVRYRCYLRLKNIYLQKKSIFEAFKKIK